MKEQIQKFKAENLLWVEYNPTNKMITRVCPEIRGKDNVVFNKIKEAISSPTRLQILEVLQDHCVLSIRELEKLLKNRAYSVVWTQVKKLEELGLVFVSDSIREGKQGAQREKQVSRRIVVFPKKATISDSFNEWIEKRKYGFEIAPFDKVSNDIMTYFSNNYYRSIDHVAKDLNLPIHVVEYIVSYLEGEEYLYSEKVFSLTNSGEKYMREELGKKKKK